MTCNLLTCAALKSDEKIQNDVQNVVGINAQVYNNLSRRAVIVEADFNWHVDSDVEQQYCPDQIPGN